MASFSTAGKTRETNCTSKLRRAAPVSVFLVMQFLLCPDSSSAFQQLYLSRPVANSRLFAVESTDDEITRQLERAKALLAKSKAKIEAQNTASVFDIEDDIEEEGKGNSKLPFFASLVAAKPKGTKRDMVVKATNAQGLVTTNGDLMAQLSESEEWEVRSLVEVFESESKTSSRDNSLANRDVAASIFGLQRVLQTEDFQKIFDKRNRFIGEQ